MPKVTEILCFSVLTMCVKMHKIIDDDTIIVTYGNNGYGPQTLKNQNKPSQNVCKSK